MDRRSFLKAMLAAAVAPGFLKGAGRIWKPARPLVVNPMINPAWVDAPYECLFWTSAVVEEMERELRRPRLWPAGLGETLASVRFQS